MSFKGSSNSGLLSWFFQRVSGVVLLLMLLFHFFIMHFYVRSSDITYKWVADRFSNPLWKIFDEGFLILALWHGFYGFKMVADDYIRSNGARIFWVSFAFILASLLFLLGSVTILSFQAS
jgi:succinate dehydrogenase / fumarate reductase membrane anchor subunit